MSRRFEANVDDCEEDSDDDNGVSEQNNKEITKIKKKKTRFLFDECCSYNRAKRAVFSPFNKVYRRFSSSSSSSSTRNSSQNRATRNSRKGGTRRSGNYVPSCCLCLSKPKTLETSLDDIDLDDPNVDIESSLKALLEQNDFYCAKCNTHLVD